MLPIHADFCASITELEADPMALIAQSIEQDEPIAIIADNKPLAYIISAERYQELQDVLDEAFENCMLDQEMAEEEAVAL